MSEPLALEVRAIEAAAGAKRSSAKRLPAKRLIGPLDLAVRAGEHVLVVGPSGSGKTTLLRAIAGLQHLRAGRISIAGALADDGPRQILPPERRGVGLLFQGGALWPHLGVRRTIEFVLAHRGVPRGERAARAGELIELCELRGLEDQKPGTLSGGEAQRLGLARALAMQPRLLLLDEPLGPLDQELRATLLRRIADVHARLRLTTLHVTHDAREVRGIADRVLRMEGGTVVEPSAAAS